MPQSLVLKGPAVFLLIEHTGFKGSEKSGGFLSVDDEKQT